MIFSWMNKSGMPNCHIQHLSGVYRSGAQWMGVEVRAAWRWGLECSWQDTLLVNFPMCRCKAWCYSDQKMMKSASSIKFMPSFTEKTGGIGWDELYATRRLWSYMVPKKCIWSKVVIISNLKCTMAMLASCYMPHVCSFWKNSRKTYYTQGVIKILIGKTNMHQTTVTDGRFVIY